MASFIEACGHFLAGVLVVMGALIFTIIGLAVYLTWVGWRERDLDQPKSTDSVT
jgi:hypothetical protein